MAEACYAVLPCAGKGKRFGGQTPKFLLDLGGISVLEQTLKNLHACSLIKGIVLCVSPETMEEMQRDILPQFAPSNKEKLFLLVSGGAERQFSIWNGVQALLGKTGNFKRVIINENIPFAALNDLVAVHDAVRPFAGPELFTQVFQKAREKNAALIAIPAQDTIKKCEETKVEKTIDRKNLWQAQTPQAFRLSTLVDANEKAMTDNFSGTDDASLVEHLGTEVYCVPGHKFNLKITTQEDFILAKAIFQKE